MGNLIIRNLDDRVKTEIRMRAAKNGHSMEEEARRLLTAAVRTSARKEVGLGTAIRRRFAALDKVNFEPLPRDSVRKPPKFE